MRATLFEFRHRWWVFAFIFFVAFFLYRFDPKNSGRALADWLVGPQGHTASHNAYRVTFGVGALVMVMSAWIRTWGTSYLHSDVMRDARVRTERLLADGPYRYVRNPLYLGNILMAVALGLMASRIGFVFLVVAMTVFVLRLILREEGELAREQGEPYRRYCAAVPRLFPSLRPRVPAAGNLPAWGQGFRAELMSWLLAVALAVFAFTLKLKPFWIVFAIAIVCSVVLRAPRIRRQPAGA